MFEIIGLGEKAPRYPGIFVYARRRGNEWQALYVGESSNLADRLAFNEIAADALLSGATDIHVLRLDGDPTVRRDVADRLILTNAPSLNEEERVRLLSLGGQAATRAA
jgi:type II secretory ATPase GspE/PulE/Tfp pilus assembly ATPase PilB-like protein